MGEYYCVHVSNLDWMLRSLVQNSLLCPMVISWPRPQAHFHVACLKPGVRSHIIIMARQSGRYLQDMTQAWAIATLPVLSVNKLEV